MHKIRILNIIFILLTCATIASAIPFSDIPTNHWAYQAISKMAEEGIVQGFPNETFNGNENVNRFQLAMITSRILANLEHNGIGSISKNDLQTLEKLTVEFADELAILGVKVTDIEKDMQVIKEDVIDLKKDVKAIKDTINNENPDKIRISGDILIRNIGSYHDRGTINGQGSGEVHQHQTESILRLQMDTDINEKVFSRIRWDLIGNNGTNIWNGANKETAKIKIAYLKIKDMFNFGGDFLFGRDKFYHGHGFVVYDYMDAVKYTKKCGKVDLGINLFFEKEGVGNTNNYLNINADFTYKGHNIYFGFYSSNKSHDDYGLPLEDKRREFRYEFGSIGKLSNKNDKFTYDLGFVYSDLEDAIAPDQNAQGLLGYLSINYDSKKRFSAKLSYTFADDESNANIKVKNLNSYSMSKETIFDDLYLDSMIANADTNRSFQNLRDYKLQIGFTPKKNNKHHLRLAYDYVTNIYDGKENTFNTVAGNPFVNFINDMRSHIFTFDYSYKITKDTRLRFGYKRSNVDARNMPELWVDLYFTELFSRF